MSKEDYVSLEVAKLLKEKGFNEPVLSQYSKCGSVWNCYEPENFNESTGCFSRPTLYEAQKWLRKQGIYIEIKPWYSRKYEIIEYDYIISSYFDLLEKNGKRMKNKYRYEKYEQCLNDAMLDSLKNQEIFKNSKSE